ncbi:phenolphthiocerol/phthiocerol polyketide synthase subunit C-like [Paramormyrops kingsleyae]|uniref:phenolphthiocerol/phthiocerol polyketide synthase subunit C-like n=1 Tax=Paramormyrops kingsleyae TaxID=1676925 RepID=UPI003B97C685
MGVTGEEIAVVGIGCNFPGGEGLDNFWKVLQDGRNCAVQIPEERFDCTHWYDPDDSKPGKSRTERASLIDGFNEFDHKFFSIDDDEAGLMDPQQKLLLECSYRALEDAGIPVEKVSGTSTGVFIGLMNRDYEQSMAAISPSVINHRNSTGTAMSIAANRISYTFDLTGPSLAIDTACSSSLVALHLAIQAIKNGDCEMALCGGVSNIMEPWTFVALSKAKMISPDGTSKPFSQHANGYGRGEGCGIVLLKPLKKALSDLDHVWGVITTSAVNQDGHSVTPITKPSVVQQKELLQMVYTDIDPSHIQYVEAHGTGTLVGDSTEAESISTVIAKGRSAGSAPLCMGSVKGNIGHTESAAGMAGLIKVLLMMHHEVIVPSVFYSEDSASIDAQALCVKVPVSAEKWEVSGPFGRAAGVNCFGFGGTNAHAVVREHKTVCSSQSKHLPVIVTLSGSSEKSLTLMMESTAQQISSDDTDHLPDLAYTSTCRRTHAKHKYRKAFLASSLSHLEEQLKSSLKKKIVPSKADPKVVFVFCGNGVTYKGMCKQLLREEPVFRDKIKEIDGILQKYSQASIFEMLDSDGNFSEADEVQPLLLAIQIAINCLLTHWGIKPDAIIGHSVGEVAAAHCSGLLSLEDTVKVIYYRSSLQRRVNSGKMLVVGNIEVSEIEKLLAAYAGRICLAAKNSPRSCTLAGDADAVDGLQQELQSSFPNKNLFIRVLNVTTAYHSHIMDPILTEVEKSIGSLQANETVAELFSTVTGKAFCKGEFSTGKYWARNIREPVVFDQTLKAAAEGRKNVIFVEIGPRPALQRNIIETLGEDAIVFSTAQPGKDHMAMLNVVCRLFELGVPVNWEQFYRGYEALPTPYPRYEFDRTKKSLSAKTQAGNGSGHPVLTNIGPNSFLCNLSSESTSYLYDHKNNGVPIIPGAFYVELALASFIASSKPKVPLNSLDLNINFQNPFVLSHNSPAITVQLDAGENEKTVKIYSSSATYASGSIKHRPTITTKRQNVSLDGIFKRCTSVLQSEEFYDIVNQLGFQYDSVFRNIGDLYRGEEFIEVVTLVKLPDAILNHLHDYCIHPVVLDYFMQMAAVIGIDRSRARPMFPSLVGSLTISEPLQEEMFLYVHKTQNEADFFDVCGYFLDRKGQVLAELKHVRITYIGSEPSDVKDLFFEYKFDVTDEEKPNTSNKCKAFVFADDMGLADELKQHLHPDSTYVLPRNERELSNGNAGDFLSKFDFPNKKYEDILFMWGIRNITDLDTESTLEHLVNCCEDFRQILLKLTEEYFPRSIRVITYRSTEKTVDQITPGFVLSGLTRSLAAEVELITFQFIDVGSLSKNDIQALSQVIHSYPSAKYPEVIVSQGQIYSLTLSNTSFKALDKRSVCQSQSECFTIQTTDPYRVSNLSAIPFSDPDTQVKEQMVEVQLSKICVHSSDFFPVTLSDLNYGQTFYWSEHSSKNHKLLALDFSGTVTAVGSDVTKFKVGDQIVSCYPVAASSKLRIPESACYSSNMLSFPVDVPCMSYFVISWEILRRMLPEVKQNGSVLGIISSERNSHLAQVLTAAVKKGGWNVTVATEASGMYDVLIFLSPVDVSSVAQACKDSKVRHIAVVCGGKVPTALSQTILNNENDNVCIEILQVEQILQKSYLRNQRENISKWLMSAHFSSTDFNFQCNTFQTAVPESSEPESYFNSKTMPVIVLDDEKMKEISEIPVHEKEKVRFLRKAVYIVSGGLSGLGFQTVKFLAKRGGGHIVILSRRKPTHEMQLEIDAVQDAYGAIVTCKQCDISIASEVTAVVQDISLKFPLCPIKGVFHSAVVLHDGLIATLDKSDFFKVLRPKVNGVLNLHRATRDFRLDYFVCYSSVASGIGNAAQSNYAAANSFMDMFCHYRRKLGLVAQTINWGPLNLGLLLDKVHLQMLLEDKGLLVMDVSEVHNSLERCLLQNNAQQIVCKFSFKNLFSNVLHLNSFMSVRFVPLMEKIFHEAKHLSPMDLNVTPPTTSEEYVKCLLCEIFNIEMEELGDDMTLAALGIDSMLAMTMQNRIYQERQIRVPLVVILDPNGTISSLISLLMGDKKAERQE